MASNIIGQPSLGTAFPDNHSFALLKMDREPINRYFTVLNVSENTIILKLKIGLKIWLK